MDEVELARLRRDYEVVGLAEPMLPADPLVLFHTWLGDAVRASLAEANAMVVSTVAPDGSPTSRLVLCKGADDRGFVFFTNYGSRKGRDIETSPTVSLLFPWHPIGRQVRVEGVAGRTDAAESLAYFQSRPRGAQLSALASAQSDVVADRSQLERRVAELDADYAGVEIPCPEHWGGIRVRPHAVEFWQGRRDRLHDRLRYRRDEGAASWSVDRLQP